MRNPRTSATLYQTAQLAIPIFRSVDVGIKEVERIIRWTMDQVPAQPGGEQRMAVLSEVRFLEPGVQAEQDQGRVGAAAKGLGKDLQPYSMLIFRMRVEFSKNVGLLG
jgi:hypothetical protein